MPSRLGTSVTFARLLPRLIVAVALAAAMILTGASAGAQTLTTALGIDVLGTTVPVTSIAYSNAVTLRAVLNRIPGGAFYPGSISFIDLSLPANSQTVGTVELQRNGTAALSLTPAIGMHIYRAVFAGTLVQGPSISSSQSLQVTGLPSTSVALTASGTPTDYTLIASFSAYGFAAMPTGTINFVDTSASNAVVGSVNLSTVHLTTAQVLSSTTTTGAHPNAIATGDFNSDGIPDAVVANDGGQLTVMLGNGDGTFTQGATINVGGPVKSVIAAELTDVGVLDLVIGLSSPNRLAIYHGNGDGTFAELHTFTLSGTPAGIVAGDFNHDGFVDLAMALPDSNSILIFTGTGYGTLLSGVTVPVGNTPTQVVVGDFNNDGNLDIATTNFGDNTVSVELGAGDATFTSAPGSPFATGHGPIALVAADLNGNGNTDLAVANQTDGTVDILLGNGSGHFTLTGSPVAVNAQPSMIVAADFNNDGAMDLLTANSGSGTVNILNNNGSAVFTVAPPIPAGHGTDAVAAVDLNGDGWLDLIATNAGDATANAYLTAQTGTASVTNIGFAVTGSHVVEAMYSGDVHFSSSTSNPVSLQSTTTNTTTTLTASPPGQAGYGQGVTLTATITPALNFGVAAAGTVIFYDQGVQIGLPVTVAGGIATVTLPLPALGAHVYKAIYSGSPGFIGNTSLLLAYTVGQATVAITLPAYTGAYGATGTTTATVAVQFPFAGQPALTGNISYQFPGFTLQTVALSSGQATIHIPAGLPAGAATLAVNYSGDANYAATTGSLSYTITAIPLTVTVNNATSVYGAALPAFTGSITGTLPGDTLTATYSTVATPASAAGTYAITAVISGTNAANYRVTVVPGTLVIGQAPIILSANNATRLFAAANPVFSGSITGAKNGDVLTLTFTTTATQLSNVGTYPIVPVLNGANAGNYTPTVLNGTLTIMPISVTLTANNATRLYGAANPAFTGSIAGAPANSGLTVTGTTTATQFSPVGSYPIIPTISGTASSNYTATLIDATLTITPTPTTTLLQSSALTSVYGASVTFKVTATPSTSGAPTGQVKFFDGANLLGTVAMTNGTASLPVVGLTVGTHTITASYNGDTNFTGSGSNSIAQIVQKAPLNVTANNTTRIYGAADPAFTNTITGTVPGDSFTVTYTTNETVTSSVGAYQITPAAQGAALVNYTVVYTPGTLTVTQSPLTITANNATRMYDTANPAFSGGVTGAKNGETFALSFSTTAVTISDVGTYPIVPAATGTTLANYNVIVVNGTLTITPATGIVVTAGNASRVYGAANPVFTGTVSGSFANLGFTVSGTTTATLTSDPGTYVIVPALGGVNPADYIATLISGVLTVSPAATSMILVSGNTTVLVGTNVNLTATIASATTGVPTGQIFFYTGTTFLGASPLVGGVANLTTNGIPLGTNTVTARYNGNTDFTASVSNAVTETIASSLPVLTATADNFARIVNTANPAFTGTVTGALNGDTFTETFTTTATISSPAGTYSIVPVVTGSNLGNYQLNVVPGVLTITQTGAALVLHSSATTVAFGTPVGLTATLTGSGSVVPTGNVLFFDGSSLLSTVPAVSGVATLTVSTLAAGVHTLTVRSAGDANYGPALSNAVTETITGSSGGGADYTLTASPASLTIKQGNTGTTTLTITPVNGYTGQVTLGCVTLPQFASCNFSQATFTLNGTTPATITLTVNTSSSVASLREPAMPGRTSNMTRVAGFALLPAMLLAGILGVRRRSGLAGMRLLIMLLAVAVMVSLSGCVTVTLQGGATQDTPVGTSTLTITASPTNVTTGVYHTLPVVITITQ